MKEIVEKLNKSQVEEMLKLFQDFGYTIKYLDDELGPVGLELSSKDGSGFMIHPSGMTATFKPYNP